MAVDDVVKLLLDCLICPWFETWDRVCCVRFFPGTHRQQIFTPPPSVADGLHPPAPRLRGTSAELSPPFCVKARRSLADVLDVRTGEKLCVTPRVGGGGGGSVSQRRDDQTEDTKQTTALRSSKHRLTRRTQRAAKPPSVFRSC